LGRLGSDFSRRAESEVGGSFPDHVGGAETETGVDALPSL